MSDVKSGKHLGAVRSWIQWNAVNGERVTWGSNDELRLKRPVTVAMMEEVAQRVADAVRYDLDEHRKYVDRLIRDKWHLEQQLAEARAKWSRLLFCSMHGHSWDSGAKPYCLVCGVDRAFAESETEIERLRGGEGE